MRRSILGTAVLALLCLGSNVYAQKKSSPSAVHPGDTSSAKSAEADAPEEIEALKT